MLTHLAFFAMGFMAASLVAMVVVCCEAERMERKNKDKDKENGNGNDRETF